MTSTRAYLYQIRAKDCHGTVLLDASITVHKRKVVKADKIVTWTLGWDIEDLYAELLLGGWELRLIDKEGFKYEKVQKCL